MATFTVETFLEAPATEEMARQDFLRMALLEEIEIRIISVKYAGETGEEDIFDITYEADEEIDY